jgi:hypothetical protein
MTIYNQTEHREENEDENRSGAKTPSGSPIPEGVIQVLERDHASSLKVFYHYAFIQFKPAIFYLLLSSLILIALSVVVYFYDAADPDMPVFFGLTMALAIFLLGFGVYFWAFMPIMMKRQSDEIYRQMRSQYCIGLDKIVILMSPRNGTVPPAQRMEIPFFVFNRAEETKDAYYFYNRRQHVITVISKDNPLLPQTIALLERQILLIQAKKKGKSR